MRLLLFACCPAPANRPDLLLVLLLVLLLLLLPGCMLPCPWKLPLLPLLLFLLLVCTLLDMRMAAPPMRKMTLATIKFFWAPG
jgi:hypothetical protein